MVDTFPDYAQIISYAMPPLEVFAKGDGAKVEEYARLINDELAEICRQGPGPLPRLGGAGRARRRRCRRRGSRPRDQERRARRADLHQRRRHSRSTIQTFEPFFAAMEKLNKPIWLHPARNASVPDYASEKTSKYEIWWTFGWSYETAAAMARLVFSKIMDKYPNIKIITHHFGGIVPMLEGRIGPGWDQLGSRTSGEDLGALLGQLKKRPLDYFKALVLCRHRDLLVGSGDDDGAVVLRPRQDRVRVGLPVRSREGHDVYPRRHSLPRSGEHARRRKREAIAYEQSRAHHRHQAGQVRTRDQEEVDRSTACSYCRRRADRPDVRVGRCASRVSRSCCSKPSRRSRTICVPVRFIRRRWK